ncbi:glycoside hydrolase family 16 protein [Halobaculum lipolyticum]|uniref:Family 16 glycosylhydrolase n=1 Tax=Halobaculum lipolyticum TaxID=3032001 RepID=A0ABD5WBA5_9EURY|nr:glycoside hydrolase family 16 protein [Halobaculum sp. DT31]
MDRRRFLRRSGIAVGTLGALATVSGTDRASAQSDPAPGGPPDGDEWAVSFEDTFDAGSLDTETWEIGWGWGRGTTTSNTQIVPENVRVSDGRLRFVGTHDGPEVRSGAVNTQDTVTFGPGSYLEARIRFADRMGFHNAFWSKPNDETWPPEIDVVEQWHSDRTVEPARHSHHHLHYSSSTEPGDDSSYEDVGVAYEPGDDVTENFHVYGVEWRTDRIVHYVDGEPVRRWTDPTVLRAMERGAPFYLMLNLNINSVGTADLDEEWGEEMVVDWVRLWEPGEQADDGHYFWVRSPGDQPAKFAFRVAGGTVELDATDTDVDYWVAEDGTVGGGTVTRASSLPGFRYDGDLVDFNYRGDVEVFIDDSRRDPEALVDESTPGPPLL